MKIILASNSPRRRELLKMCNIDFEIVTEEIDEEKITEDIMSKCKFETTYEMADEITKSLAYYKGKGIFEKNPDSIVISSDTLVVDEIGILGKPKSEEEAYSMLRRLSGKTHRVYTAVAIFGGNTRDHEVFTEVSSVRFYDYDEDMERIISDYVKSGSPMDKAGGYGIQDYGGLLVKEVSGDYYTIVGLPLSRVYRRLMARL